MKFSIDEITTFRQSVEEIDEFIKNNAGFSTEVANLLEAIGTVSAFAGKLGRVNVKVKGQQ